MCCAAQQQQQQRQVSARPPMRASAHGDEFRAVALAELAAKLLLKLALRALRAAAVGAQQRQRLLARLAVCDDRDLERGVFGMQPRCAVLHDKAVPRHHARQCPSCSASMLLHASQHGGCGLSLYPAVVYHFTQLPRPASNLLRSGGIQMTLVQNHASSPISLGPCRRLGAGYRAVLGGHAARRGNV